MQQWEKQKCLKKKNKEYLPKLTSVLGHYEIAQTMTLQLKTATCFCRKIKEPSQNVEEKRISYSLYQAIINEDSGMKNFAAESVYNYWHLADSFLNLPDVNEQKLPKKSRKI
jgi:hypothetical protein